MGIPGEHTLLMKERRFCTQCVHYFPMLIPQHFNGERTVREHVVHECRHPKNLDPDGGTDSRAYEHRPVMTGSFMAPLAEVPELVFSTCQECRTDNLVIPSCGPDADWYETENVDWVIEPRTDSIKKLSKSLEDI